MPDINLKRRERLYGERLLYEETMRLRTLILVLKEQHNMPTYKVLLEMEKSAQIFKDTLIDINAGMTRPSGAKEIEKAIKNIDYAPFQSILKRILKAEKKMSLYEAFDDLDMNMSFAEMLRRDQQIAISESRVGQLHALSDIGPTLTVFCYFLMPIMVSIIMMLQQLQNISY